MRQRLPRHIASGAFSALGALAAGRGYARREYIVGSIMPIIVGLNPSFRGYARRVGWDSIVRLGEVSS